MSATNDLIALKHGKNPCDFLSKVQTLFLISMPLLGEFFEEPPAFYFRKPFCSCRFVVFFLVYVGKSLTSEIPSRNGEKPAMIFRKKLAVNFVEQEKIQTLEK